MHWDLAFDIGSDCLRVMRRGSADIQTEAALAAYRRGQDAPFAWGDKAFAFVGREAPGMSILSCVNGGIPENIPLYTAWIRRETGVTDKNYMMKRRRVLLAVSPALDEARGETLMSSIVDDGIETVGLVPSDFAAALGAGIDATAPESCFVLDIGASLITWSAIALGQRVKLRTLPFGMKRADRSIEEAVRSREALIIGKRTARLLKQSAFGGSDSAFIVAGLDPATRLPVKKRVHTEVISDALSDVIADIARLCRDAMSDLPVGMAEDIMTKGLTVTGGGSALSGLIPCLRTTLGIPVYQSPAAGDSTVLGLGRIMEEPDRFAILLSDWKGLE